MLKNLLLAIVICTAVAFCIYLIHPISFVSQAKASEYRHCWDLDGCPNRRHHRPRVRYYAAPEYEAEGQRESDGWKCLDKVHVVGSQWANEDGAEDSAKKAFMEEVRFRSGEAFMDVDHARDYEKRCTRSSIGEVAGAMLFRCEVAARPCRPPLKSDEAKR